ncbi:hypothetical protein Cob_v006288 [Colletotrichum orbiculare MAFF 240422]|uniref:Uncharacterized protein n=1 Tax=Colletotrichum orbiculare (strain 104-T / ATCC 96160 / CBS 514.97 / LARS 414 / MAFF 240422) TaxID=1213857 RepID=A0A484FR42_COLOR|nr:hypothetical protein Cob_v006288 [Colletotrichum orbiculare MAFF 240422]
MICRSHCPRARASRELEADPFRRMEESVKGSLVRVGGRTAVVVELLSPGQTPIRSNTNRSRDCGFLSDVSTSSTACFTTLYRLSQFLQLSSGCWRTSIPFGAWRLSPPLSRSSLPQILPLLLARSIQSSFLLPLDPTRLELINDTSLRAQVPAGCEECHPIHPPTAIYSRDSAPAHQPKLSNLPP